jgi:tetratricopeptide (TPR) repeat protein
MSTSSSQAGSLGIGWVAAVALALGMPQSHAATPAKKSDAQQTLSTVSNSSIDAPLFLQILVGELQLREGEAGAAYQVILDAARRTESEQLFRRATDIALQQRAGPQALAAANNWQQVWPESLMALRYQVQLLDALNRPLEVLEPLQKLLRLTPAAERLTLISNVPRLFSRSADKGQIATLTEQALRPYFNTADTRAVARVSVAKAWWAAQQPTKTLELVQRAHSQDPSATAPVELALELPLEEAVTLAIVQNHLTAKPDSNDVRLVYARSLLKVFRYVAAQAQLEAVTQNAPQLTTPWLMLAAVHLQLRDTPRAIEAAQRYVKLAQTAQGATDATAELLNAGWLFLSQAAQQQGDLTAEQAWLNKIEIEPPSLEVEVRRASLLARQGKLAQARERIQRIPENNATDARTKLLAEAQMLRDGKNWVQAEAWLAQAAQKLPDDVDLLYERSIALEKLERFSEMERLLRRVIDLNPQHSHAHNALGYSLAERNVRLPEAHQLIQKALQLSPGEPSIIDSLGWVEYRLGRLEEALRLLREAYKEQPDAEVAAHLGEVLWASGQKEEARRIWREGQRSEPANESLLKTLQRLRAVL